MMIRRRVTVTDNNNNNINKTCGRFETFRKFFRTPVSVSSKANVSLPRTSFYPFWQSKKQLQTVALQSQSHPIVRHLRMCAWRWLSWAPWKVPSSPGTPKRFSTQTTKVAAAKSRKPKISKLIPVTHWVDGYYNVVATDMYGIARRRRGKNTN